MFVTLLRTRYTCMYRGGGVQTPHFGSILFFWLACLSKRSVSNVRGYSYPVSGKLTKFFLRKKKIVRSPPPPPPPPPPHTHTHTHSSDFFRAGTASRLVNTLPWKKILHNATAEDTLSCSNVHNLQIRIIYLTKPSIIAMFIIKIRLYLVWYVSMVEFNATFKSTIGKQHNTQTIQTYVHTHTHTCIWCKSWTLKNTHK